MYMQRDPIHMAYMNSVNSVVTDLCTNFMILGLMMLGVCACVCVSVRCMTKLRMAKNHSHIYTPSFVDLVCHSNLCNLLPHGMWHVLKFLSIAAQCLVSEFPSFA